MNLSVRSKMLFVKLLYTTHNNHEETKLNQHLPCSASAALPSGTPSSPCVAAGVSSTPSIAAIIVSSCSPLHRSLRLMSPGLGPKRSSHVQPMPSSSSPT
ncbi:unnamed protein product [Cuscuta epithymum]|uniref:Uncharacterized protein n=1 Tax=Cuscuta epithymum TaxID=186058 RepID=A0AAV0F323_9ASTE|nr:unnamed protein product [Cuscuta epithymum]